MLVDVAAIDHAHGALPHQRGRFVEHGAQIFLAAAAHQHRAARRLDHAVEILGIGGRVGLDDVRAHLAGKPGQRDDLFGIAVDHVAALFGDRLHHQRLDHQRHAVFVAIGADAGNVLHALAEQVRLVRQHEQVDDDAGRIHLQRADQRLGLVLQHRPHVAMAAAGYRDCPCRCA